MTYYIDEGLLTAAKMTAVATLGTLMNLVVLEHLAR